MITVRLQGGLGNQMFQYAAGFSASKKQNTNLILDISGYESQSAKDTPRAYELGCFSLSQNNFGKIPKIKVLYRKVVNRIRPKDPYSFYPEDLRKKTLIGFFQNAKYFSDIREHIIAEFKPVQTSDDFIAMKDRISKTSSVSMHIRRGDYVTNAYANAHNGFIGKDYYVNAYRKISDLLDHDFTLYVFTDDAEWAKEHITFHKNTQIVSEHNLQAFEELLLMAACEHNIIANSSFSWWSAWLNQNPNKTVIAPRYWIAKKIDCDIFLPTWIKI